MHTAQQTTLKQTALKTWISATSRLAVAPIGSFALGSFLGFVAVSMWQQWSLTFGLDPVLLLAVALVLAATLWAGRRWQQSPSMSPSQRTLAYVVLCLSAWTMLHPYWVDVLASLMSYVPITWLENPPIKLGLGLALAFAVWWIPGMLWAAILSQSSISPGATSGVSPIVVAGVAFGLISNAVGLSSWTGIFLPTTVVCVVATIIGVWIRFTATEPLGHQTESEISGSDDGQILVRVVMTILVGGLFACHLRLVDQLMPHGAFVIYAQLAGIFLGTAGGLICVPYRMSVSDRATWGGLFAAAVSSLLLAAQPSLVHLSLWMNSSLTNAWWLMAARTGLLLASSLPFGVVLAWIGTSVRVRVVTAAGHGSETLLGSGAGSEPRAQHPGLERQNNVAWGSPFLVGTAAAMFILGQSMEVFALMAGFGSLLLVACVYLGTRTSGWTDSYRTVAVSGCLLLAALTLPIWRANDDVFRTAKILFSTPAFVAYRSGWLVEQLPTLDDIRMIHHSEGENGPLTLWRGRVAELYVREAGCPRAVISCNPTIVPQFPPEVLQAVYPMLIAERPSRVLLLGLSAGVPLSTCLDFPILEAVCVEGDQGLIDLVQGPVARATGYDPLSDERVKLRRINPELALMTEPAEAFDVILSSPSASSIVTHAPAYTREFYQRAASRLSERGLFCQRFEAVDYGPEPLRIVLKSMRQAFRKVIGIETAYGEMLLFGANTDEMFFSDELADRLERPHVLRILARCGLDWSALLNHPIYDHDALGELCNESSSGCNSVFNGLLAAQSPLEVMRWGNKLQELQDALTTTRVTKAPFWAAKSPGEPNKLDEEISLSRRSRLVDWLGDSRVSLELRRRLDEVDLQRKLVHENPDSHWWEYRKVLRKQLQDHPRSLVQQVRSIDEKRKFHPEDVRRRDYFVALGTAVDQNHTPTRDEIAAVEEFLEPNDPLLSYFAKQEIADMLSRCDEDVAREMSYRLHVIYFTPTRDASVRNVASAIETLSKHPEAIPEATDRFDALNGLLQTLRARWELRLQVADTSPKKIQEDIEQSLLAVEKGITALDQLAPSVISSSDWAARKRVLDKILMRALRAYRNELNTRQTNGQAQVKALLDSVEKHDTETEAEVPGR